MLGALAATSHNNYRTENATIIVRQLWKIWREAHIRIHIWWWCFPPMSCIANRTQRHAGNGFISWCFRHLFWMIAYFCVFKFIILWTIKCETSNFYDSIEFYWQRQSTRDDVIELDVPLVKLVFVIHFRKSFWSTGYHLSFFFTIRLYGVRIKIHSEIPSIEMEFRAKFANTSVLFMDLSVYNVHTIRVTILTICVICWICVILKAIETYRGTRTDYADSDNEFVFGASCIKT